jgi:hypothetical protein
MVFSTQAKGSIRDVHAHGCGHGEDITHRAVFGDPEPSVAAHVAVPDDAISDDETGDVWPDLLHRS